MADLTDSDDESTVVQERNNQNGLRRGSRNRLPPESVRNYRNLMEARRDQMFESDDEDEDEDASSDEEEEDEDVAIDEEEEDEDEPLMKGEEEAAPSPRRIDSIESQGNRNRQRTNTASEDEEEDHNVVNTSQQLSQASLKDGDEGNNIEADDSAMLPPPDRPQQINDIDNDDDDDEQPRSIYDICTPNVIQDWITEHHEFDVNSIPAPRKVKGNISSIFDLSANLDYAAKSLFGREDRPYPNNTECLLANKTDHVKYLPKSDRVRAMMSRAMIPAHICNFPGMKRNGYLIKTENINLFLYPYVWKAYLKIWDTLMYDVTKPESNILSELSIKEQERRLGLVLASFKTKDVDYFANSSRSWPQYCNPREIFDVKKNIALLRQRKMYGAALVFGDGKRQPWPLGDAFTPTSPKGGVQILLNHPHLIAIIGKYLLRNRCHKVKRQDVVHTEIKTNYCYILDFTNHIHRGNFPVLGLNTFGTWVSFFSIFTQWRSNGMKLISIDDFFNDKGERSAIFDGSHYCSSIKYPSDMCRTSGETKYHIHLSNNKVLTNWTCCLHILLEPKDVHTTRDHKCRGHIKQTGGEVVRMCECGSAKISRETNIVCVRTCLGINSIAAAPGVPSTCSQFSLSQSTTTSNN